MYRELTDGWTARLTEGDPPPPIARTLHDGFPAAVPGVVHLDLLRAGLIEDPYVDDAESRLHWIGDADWEYRTTFDWTDDGAARHDLVAEGLDTVATVTLNGVVVARTANQHRGYRTDVRERLREGANELVVAFRSPTRYAREQEAILGERPHSYAHPFNTIRKTACNFGWDWGIDVATAGIWRRIGIESWSGARIAAVRPITRIDGAARGLDAHIDLEWQAGTEHPVSLDVAAAGRSERVSVEPGTASVTVALDGCDAELWWPRSHGAQPLYPLTVELSGADAAARWERRIGFRTVELDLSPDEIGSAFAIRVNGEDVYIRGANWIPDDTFFPRITKDTLRRSITDAVEANLNLLRVWGGGMYESEEFYELCDEHGLLVWQDFLTACAAYSEDEPLWSEFEAEAREAVTRLAAHPSLVLWNGCNENIWGYVDWNWRSRLGGLSWGERYYTELFPAIVAELAPGTPYVEGSPFSFSRYVHPNDDRHGSMHIWDVWNQVDYTGYRRYRPRFVSEFGFQGPPTFSTLEYAVHDEPRDPFGPSMLVHQKADDGNAKLQRGLGEHLPYPADFEDWHWATQLNQARAIGFAIEYFRSLSPENRGAIVWQLNDIWPSISWAAVDYLRHRKPLWYALRRVYADRLATLQVRDDGVDLVVHNESRERYRAGFAVARTSLEGVVLAEERFPVDVEPRGLVRIPLPEAFGAGDASGEFLLARADDGLEALGYFAEDTALALRGGPAATAAVVPDGYLVTVTASALAKDVTILADKVHPDAVVDRALVTIVPGESAVFHVTAPAGLDPDAFCSSRVLRSANDLVAVPVVV
ncbi:glycoside hydrolase family 2 TIM barrel-domain containing protein [Galbitalea sp. SE-J8]|uniref:glycoside hydrolase family 2 protein n=1 Tax=Galbitalea sp. SE-J8 TaxID=3054952 RepID=UPI00259D019E|nr:glycoside hydrolase family 2 TIM barrel-domain containing protein [Galbitalea sp. SE-J8]MDM4762051.1 glycoside hydrolase family 2 TIM barrel-domain containing protein [Galbitalea sp. SE-J8]